MATIRTQQAIAAWLNAGCCSKSTVEELASSNAFAQQLVSQQQPPFGLETWLKSNKPLALSYCNAYWQTAWNCQPTTLPTIPATYASYFQAIIHTVCCFP